MKTTIALKSIEFFAYHGYYAIEQKTGHTFIVDVDVDIDTFDEVSDDIEDTVNYEELYNIVDQCMKETEKLLETVVYKILERIKIKYPHALHTKVTLQKIRPQLGGKVDRAVITMSE